MSLVEWKREKTRRKRAERDIAKSRGGEDEIAVVAEMLREAERMEGRARK